MKTTPCSCNHDNLVFHATKHVSGCQIYLKYREDFKVNLISIVFSCALNLLENFNKKQRILMNDWKWFFKHLFQFCWTMSILSCYVCNIFTWGDSPVTWNNFNFHHRWKFCPTINNNNWTERNYSLKAFNLIPSDSSIRNSAKYKIFNLTSSVTKFCLTGGRQ